MIRKFAAVFLLLAVILSAGCVAEQTAENGDTAFVYYTLTLDDGTVFQSNVGAEPLSFVIGSGEVVSGFNDAVLGMKPGETKKVRLSPAEAYGEMPDAEAMSVADLTAKIGRAPVRGDVLTVTVTTDSGYSLAYLKILDIDGDTAYVVLVGSPLVGEYLTFEITLDSLA